MAKSTNKKRSAPKEVEVKNLPQRNIQKPPKDKTESSSEEFSEDEVIC